MDAMLKSNKMKQLLIDELPNYYSEYEVFRIGRLLDIDKISYHGEGITRQTLVERFITKVYQEQKESMLISLLRTDEKLFREKLVGIIKDIDNQKIKIAPQN
ncbi:hypothetical protein [Alkaliphilus transvaalensis]|uniref:hypothetical protein n=1 Tax=Alkaliphilus transvaalensis TaxID=114628 RepID=UPI00047C8FA2|nr:hypothetical protein [Alkaliphilus transvaalensis]